MLYFMLSIFSAILGMNMRDHHDIPFALPLLFFIFLGFIISITVLKFIGNEEAEESEYRNARYQEINEPCVTRVYYKLLPKLHD